MSDLFRAEWVKEKERANKAEVENERLREERDGLTYALAAAETLHEAELARLREERDKNGYMALAFQKENERLRSALWDNDDRFQELIAAARDLFPSEAGIWDSPRMARIVAALKPFEEEA